MPEPVDKAFEIVQKLVQDFAAHESAYLSSTYTEAQVRQDFIDKFLTALGWDVTHVRQRNPFEQEVHVERGVVDGPAKRRADYSFAIAPNFRDIRFFVEAKKPFGDIATRDNYFQTIRYAWNSNTPISILTDFEQLHVLDCRFKPAIDSVLDRRIRKYHFTHYADKEKFAEIFFLIGRDAVANGSIENFADSLPRRRGAARQRGLFRGGYQAIDDAFLEELDSHREALAKTFKKDNPSLDGGALTEITQRVLDRLVFIRFLEDKLIETDHLVASFGSGGSVWGDFVAASRRLDAVYNGIVFKRHSLIDTSSLVVDDHVFGDVCEALSHINSPYDFNAIPIHILGSIYERFLGRVIVTTAKTARVEEKPEVRKAGGVYYTPQPIVRYLVRHTVGKLIDGKSPTQIASMRFLDLACGSGSFLLGVYELLLQHHMRWYSESPTASDAKDFFLNDDGTIHIALSKRRQILVNNVYGVDVDPQAVEVAQLSLYLKLLESESTASARTYQLEFHTTVLPSLNANVLSGNSLIGPDVCQDDLFGNSEEAQALNPIDLPDKFEVILKKGGFDAVVGNPPYVRPHNLSQTEKEYFWSHFKTFTHKSDLYCCFVERGTEFLKDGGMLGLILSHGWLRLNSFQELRRHILDSYRIHQLVELPFKVFADANVETGLVVLERANGAIGARATIDVREGVEKDGAIHFTTLRRIPQRAFSETFQNVFDLSISPETSVVKDKMRKGVPLGEMYSVVFGLKTGDDSKFLHTTAGLHPQDEPLLRGENVKRYGYHHEGEFVWYVPQKMRQHRQTARPGEPARFEQPKVLVKDTSKDFACAYDDQNFYVKDVLIVIPKDDATTAYDLRFLTAVINSRVLRFYYRTTFKTLHVQNEELASLPLPKIASRGPAKDLYKQVIEMSDQLRAIREKILSAFTERDADFFIRRFTDLDERVDQAMYLLYGLKEADIEVVEREMAVARGPSPQPNLSLGIEDDE